MDGLALKIEKIKQKDGWFSFSLIPGSPTYGDYWYSMDWGKGFHISLILNEELYRVVRTLYAEQ